MQEFTEDSLGFTEEPLGFTDLMFTVESQTDDMFTDDTPIDECLGYENIYSAEFMHKFDNGKMIKLALILLNIPSEGFLMVETLNISSDCGLELT